MSEQPSDQSAESNPTDTNRNSPANQPPSHQTSTHNLPGNQPVSTATRLKKVEERVEVLEEQVKELLQEREQDKQA